MYKEFRIGNYTQIDNKKYYPLLSEEIFEVVRVQENGLGMESAIKDDDILDVNQKYKFIKPIELTQKLALKLGFKEIAHFTVGNTLILDVGRNRQLSFSNIGTPNEMLFLNQMNEKDSKKVDDLICIHNFDYDGYLHIHELQNICSIFKVELTL